MSYQARLIGVLAQHFGGVDRPCLPVCLLHMHPIPWREICESLCLMRLSPLWYQAVSVMMVLRARRCRSRSGQPCIACLLGYVHRVGKYQTKRRCSYPYSYSVWEKARLTRNLRASLPKSGHTPLQANCMACEHTNIAEHYSGEP